MEEEVAMPGHYSILKVDREWINRVVLNSLTAISAHERPLFNELRGSVVSRRVFFRSQSLIAR